MSNTAKIMANEEMKDFIEKVGRTELFDEKEDLANANYKLVRENTTPYPRYLKAVRVSLVALGYDEKWVEGEFRDALEAHT